MLFVVGMRISESRRLGAGYDKMPRISGDDPAVLSSLEHLHFTPCGPTQAEAW
jgi:hypothetical protein